MGVPFFSPVGGTIIFLFTKGAPRRESWEPIDKGNGNVLIYSIYIELVKLPVIVMCFIGLKNHLTKALLSVSEKLSKM